MINVTYFLLVGGKVKASTQRAPSGWERGGGAELLHLQAGGKISGTGHGGCEEERHTKEEGWGDNLDGMRCSAVASSGGEGEGLEAENRCNNTCMAIWLYDEVRW